MMKSFRIIALVLCLALVVPMIASCTGNQQSTTTTTTTTTTPPPAKDPVVIIDFGFDGGNADEPNPPAEGFGVSRWSPTGSIVNKDGKLTVDNGVGAYFVHDNDLSLNSDNYQTLEISFDVQYQAYPTSGAATLVAPLFSVGGTTEYQGFLKVDNSGKLQIYNSTTKWYVPVTNADGSYVTLQLNKTYEIKIVYTIATGAFTAYVDDTAVGSDMLIYIMDEDVTEFKITFFDSNSAVGVFSATLDNLYLVAKP